MKKELLDAIKQTTIQRVEELARDMEAFKEGCVCFSYGKLHVDDKPFLKYVLFHFNVKNCSKKEVLTLLGTNLLSILDDLEREANK